MKMRFEEDDCFFAKPRLPHWPARVTKATRDCAARLAGVAGGYMDT